MAFKWIINSICF